MEALKLSRADFSEAVQKIGEASENGAYLDKFSFEFPEGLNTANSLEICRAIQNDSFDAKVNLMRICIAGKKVCAVCPNGEKMDFRLGHAEDNLDALPFFQSEPLGAWALAESVYGYILKKYLRSSPAQVKPQTSKA